jgi:hypothetical protein
MADILTDYRKWRASLEDRIGTHGPGCHMWPRHERCMIHGLAGALAVEMAKRTLTDAEREAIGFAAVFYDLGGRADEAATLRGLLERTR